MKIAIIGGGFSGAITCKILRDLTSDIEIFEKSRGAGGRCSTKYIDDFKIDHGTASFEATNSDFVNLCEELCRDNILKYSENRYFPINGINKICSKFLDDSRFHKNCKIVNVKFDEGWTLQNENGEKFGKFDKLILTIPATQILQMQIDLSDEFKSKLEKIQYDQVASLLIYGNCKESLTDIFEEHKDFRKIINNSQKYGYKNFQSFIFHLNSTLSNKLNFSNKEEVQEFIVEKIEKIFGINLEKFSKIGHLWRYGFANCSLDEEFLYDGRLGICGDYFGKDNIQTSFLSSTKLAKEISKSLV